MTSGLFDICDYYQINYHYYKLNCFYLMVNTALICKSRREMMGKPFREFYQQMSHYGDRPDLVNHSNYAPLRSRTTFVANAPNPFSLGYFIDHSDGKANVLVLISSEESHDLLNPHITPWMLYSSVREIILQEGFWITYKSVPEPNRMDIRNKLDAVFVAVPNIAATTTNAFIALAGTSTTSFIHDYLHQYLQYLADRLTLPVYAPRGEIRNRFHSTSRGTSCFCVRDYQQNQLEKFYPRGAEPPEDADPFWI
ncbi:hypothetical protein Xmau_01239 [Xenorhabdus mauleonii]|uniref:Uncharacterized protein n=1 Tax=Xenorhabdus mauleonii TaxID=351675 RepID=A0A1I3KFN9_9GAMM|nr:hypothetical protein [Xenorhabdus mauleonii]PHM45034.1 hypothetical protein Xmau_01239 [Xenorhabdus mauleonii]SFI71214.1 hypothetical protein SAMN05421680_10368 [Xenorhabdus mauleonii]